MASTSHAMAGIELRAFARERKGEWRQNRLAAIGLAVGIVDRDMRQILPDALARCAVVTIGCGALYVLARRSLTREIVVGTDRAGAFVRLAGAGELRPPLHYRHGWHREHVDAGVARADVVVLFVSIEGQNGTLVLSKALGAAFSAPEGWPPGSPTIAPAHTMATLEALPAALERVGIRSLHAA